MEKTCIDMSASPRRAHFEYFSAMANPYMGLTVELELGGFRSAMKRRGAPFFLSFLWCVTRAANSVPELRRRIAPDGSVVEFARCRSSHTLALDDGTYCYCELDAAAPLDEYIPYARREQERARAAASLSDGDGLDLLFISSLPWLSYAALVQPTPAPADSNPRITWGRVFERGGREYIPLTVLCNHALVDGLHLAQFFDALRRELDSAAE